MRLLSAGFLLLLALGAAVWLVVSPPADPDRQAGALDQGHSGQGAQSDAETEAVVEPEASDLAGELERQSMPPSSQGQIEFGQGQRITVFAKDGDGQPVEALPIGLLQAGEHPWFPSFDTTDVLGVATLAKIGQVAAKASDADSFWVRPMIPLGDYFGIQVDLDPPPKEPLELAVPALGQLELEVLEADGSPVEGTFQAFVSTADDGFTLDPSADLRSQMGKNPAMNFRASGQSGHAKFPYVGLGLNFFVQIDPAYGESIFAYGPGPIAPGETVKILVRRPEPTGFRIRLVDELGHPIPNVRWHASYVFFFEDYSSSSAESGETDSEGRTFLNLTDSELLELQDADGTELEMTARLWETAKLWTATESFPKKVEVGTNDWGDLTLFVQNSLSLNGKVVDLAGEPIFGANFMMQELAWTDDQREDWQHVGYARTNSEGVFHFLAIHPEAPVRYVVYKKGYLGILEAGMPEPDPVFVLDPGFHIQGSFHFPEMDRKFSLDLMKRPSDQPQAPWSYFHYLRPKKNEILLEGLEPEAVDLAIRSRKGAIILAVIPGILPWNDEAQADLRLAPWRIQPSPNQVELKVLDGSGETVDGLKIQILDDSFEHSSKPFIFRPGEVLLIPTDSTRVKLQAPGFRSLETAVQAGTNTLRMAPGLSVQLQIPGLAAQAPAGMKYALRSRSSADSRNFELEKTFTTVEQLTLQFPTPGPHQITIVQFPADDDPWEESSQILLEQWIEVIDQAAVQQITLSIQ
jgi:hypothetical protein